MTYKVPWFVTDPRIDAKAVAKAQFDLKIEPDPLGELLVQAGSSDCKISSEAAGKLTEPIFHKIKQELILQTNLPIKVPEVGVAYGDYIVLATSVDMLLQYAADNRQSIFMRMIEVMANSLSNKINKEKQSSSYLMDLNVFNDPSIHKMRKLGYYAWVNLYF
jgi:hypothetical protein